MRYIHARIITMDQEKRVFDDGYIDIENGTIVAVGPMTALPDALRKDARDMNGAIIMPGLINTHTHISMVLFRGLADDLPLKQWLEQYIWPMESAMVNEEFVRYGALLGMMEMLRTGTTCFADMYFYEQRIADEVEKAGMRAALGYSNIDFPTPEASHHEEGIRISEDLLQQWKGHHRIKPIVCTHAPYTCSPSLFAKIGELAALYDTAHMVHIAETKIERTLIASNTKKLSPVQWMEQHGFLNERILAAHAVWLDESDIYTMKSRNVKVSHNISSNCKLGSGIADIQRYTDEGITVSLGTDGAASNNMLNMFAEMRLAALVHKGVRLDPLAVPAYQAIEMATINGARALGIESITGSLEVGKSADFIVSDTNAVSLTPLYNPVSHVVYASTGAEVAEVYVEGKCLYERGIYHTIDAEKVLKEATRLSHIIKEKLTP